MGNQFRKNNPTADLTYDLGFPTYEVPATAVPKPSTRRPKVSKDPHVIHSADDLRTLYEYYEANPKLSTSSEPAFNAFASTKERLPPQAWWDSPLTAAELVSVGVGVQAIGDALYGEEVSSAAFEWQDIHKHAPWARLAYWRSALSAMDQDLASVRTGAPSFGPAYYKGLDKPAGIEVNGSGADLVKEIRKRFVDPMLRQTEGWGSVGTETQTPSGRRSMQRTSSMAKSRSRSSVSAKGARWKGLIPGGDAHQTTQMRDDCRTIASRIRAQNPGPEPAVKTADTILSTSPRDKESVIDQSAFLAPPPSYEASNAAAYATAEAEKTTSPVCPAPADPTMAHGASVVSEIDDQDAQDIQEWQETPTETQAEEEEEEPRITHPLYDTTGYPTARSFDQTKSRTRYIAGAAVATGLLGLGVYGICTRTSVDDWKSVTRTAVGKVSSLWSRAPKIVVSAAVRE